MRWRRYLPVLPITLFLAALFGASLFIARQHGQNVTSADYVAFDRSTPPLTKLWRVPDFAYLDQRGQRTTRSDLAGKPFVADFIFTSCTTACPMMTAKMTMLERRLAGVDLRFVSFSVDPEHDTPKALAEYATRWHGDPRWVLLSTTEKELPDTLDGFRVTAEPTGVPEDPIMHSSLFFLVDGEGWVRGAYDSIDSAGMARLVEDARALVGAQTPAPAATAGSRFDAFGCNGCHSRPEVAPPLAGLAGSSVKLKDGTTVVADDAYLRRALLEPGVQIVAGYLPLMPSYQGVLSDADVGALLDELKAMNGPRQERVTGGEAVDPVCGMTVVVAPETPHVTLDGAEHYFCSDTCKTRFLKKPEAFRHPR